MQKGSGGNTKGSEQPVNMLDEWIVDYLASEEDAKQSFENYIECFNEAFEEIKNG